MEEDLSRRRPQWKTTSVEDDLTGRQTHWKRYQWKTTSLEDNLGGRRPQWKTTSVGDNLSGKEPQWTVLAWNQQNICRSNLVESETILKRWKTTSMVF